MASNSGKIDLVLNSSGINKPSCEHGPALLFVKYDGKSTEGRQFFACSAFRNRKVCPFFRWADDVRQTSKQTINPHLLDSGLTSFNHKQCRKRFKQFLNIKEEERTMCLECGLFLLENEVDTHKGQGHKLRKGISRSQLSRPTKLFTPLDDNKTYAQYLFTEKTVEFIVSSLRSLDVTHVLSIGCPRIHEYIVNKNDDKSVDTLSSLLLDLDHRYLQLYPPNEFLRYNMMNHYFFGGDTDMHVFNTFIEERGTKRVAVLADPPFGILVEGFANTLTKIQEAWVTRNTGKNTKLPVLWIFPYFMEKRVVECCSAFTMLDYKWIGMRVELIVKLIKFNTVTKANIPDFCLTGSKQDWECPGACFIKGRTTFMIVDYDNHSLFKKDDGRKKGSPVRIFTNIEPKKMKLSTDDGYWFCKRCEKYCAPENKHCTSCNSCTTKDGPTYRHCDKCGKCVKPSRLHCEVCGYCDLQDHVCGRSLSTGCHICGENGHKRRDCPNKTRQKEQGIRDGKRKKFTDKQQFKKKKMLKK